MTGRSPDDLSAFERQIASKRPINSNITRASKTVTIRPEEFLYSWSSRPSSPIVVGLRLLSIQDQESGHQDSLNAGPDGSPEYRRAAIAFAVARGICDPNDVTKPHPLLEFAEDMVPAALSRGTIDRLFDELEKLAIEVVPLFAEITPEELLELNEILMAEDPFENMSMDRAARVRRYLRFALNELLEGQ